MNEQKIINTRFKIRLDTTANWNANETKILLKGEPAVEITELGKWLFKIGDGTTQWKNLKYYDDFDLITTYVDGRLDISQYDIVIQESSVGERVDINGTLTKVEVVLNDLPQEYDFKVILYNNSNKELAVVNGKNCENRIYFDFNEGKIYHDGSFYSTISQQVLYLVKTNQVSYIKTSDEWAASEQITTTYKKTCTVKQYIESRLGDIGDITMKQYVDDVIAALPKGIVYKGTVNYYKDLPKTGQEIGDCYTVKYKGESGTVPYGAEFIWGNDEGTNKWIYLGEMVEGAVRYDTTQTLTDAQKLQAITNIGAAKSARIGGTTGTIADKDSEGNIIIPVASSNLGLIKTGGYSFNISNGMVKAEVMQYENYKVWSENNFISKGSLENVLNNEAVRIDKAQSLTEAQKLQARGNTGSQETLVSGTNIKTINNNSILGSGNIEINPLPTTASASEIMIYNGTKWQQQAGYGYELDTRGSLSWDGDTTGKEYKESEFGAVECKISNDVSALTLENLIGKEYKYNVDGEETAGTWDTDNLVQFTDYISGQVFSSVYMYIVTADSALVHPFEETLTKGVWFGKNLAGNYLSKVSYGELSITQIESKFIPHDDTKQDVIIDSNGNSILGGSGNTVASTAKNTTILGDNNTISATFDPSDIPEQEIVVGYHNTQACKNAGIIGKENTNKGNNSFMTGCFGVNEGTNSLITGYMNKNLARSSSVQGEEVADLVNVYELYPNNLYSYRIEQLIPGEESINFGLKINETTFDTPVYTYPITMKEGKYLVINFEEKTTYYTSTSGTIESYDAPAFDFTKINLSNLGTTWKWMWNANSGHLYYGNINFDSTNNNIIGGSRNEVSGINNLVIGAEHNVRDSYNLVSGAGHIIQRGTNYQTIVGKYSVPDINAAFIIGNGTEATKRSNIFKILKSGKIEISNDIVNQVGDTIIPYIFDINDSIRYLGATLEGKTQVTILDTGGDTKNENKLILNGTVSQYSGYKYIVYYETVFNKWHVETINRVLERSSSQVNVYISNKTLNMVDTSILPDPHLWKSKITKSYFGTNINSSWRDLEIPDNSVSTNKIVDQSITEAKLNNGVLVSKKGLIIDNTKFVYTAYSDLVKEDTSSNVIACGTKGEKNRIVVKSNFLGGVSQSLVGKYLFFVRTDGTYAVESIKEVNDRGSDQWGIDYTANNIKSGITLAELKSGYPVIKMKDSLDTHYQWEPYVNATEFDYVVLKSPTKRFKLDIDDNGVLNTTEITD